MPVSRLVIRQRWRAGAIPGTSIGSPGHPQGTHVNGYDMDIGYYQQGTADNKLRPVCEHVQGGADQYHCVGEPDLLDVWRTSLVLGLMHDTPQLRVIGVDGRIGPLVDSAMEQLCDAGWLAGNACTRPRIVYEETNTGMGWFGFHHHHFHVSLMSRADAGLPRILSPDALLYNDTLRTDGLYLPKRDLRADWSILY